MEEFMLVIFVGFFAALVSSCNTDRGNFADCATKGEMVTTFTNHKIKCEIVKETKESK